MKKLLIAGAVFCSMAVMAATVKNHETVTSKSGLDLRVYQDTPPGKGKKMPNNPQDSTRHPWPDSTKPTPPAN
jgi:hypothetical protein